MVLSHFSLIQTITALDSDGISWLHLQITGPLSFFAKKKKLLFWLLFLLVISHCRLKNHFLDYDHSGHNTTCIYYTLCLFLFSLWWYIPIRIMSTTSGLSLISLSSSNTGNNTNPQTPCFTVYHQFYFIPPFWINLTRLVKLMNKLVFGHPNTALMRSTWEQKNTRKPPFLHTSFYIFLYCAIDLWSVKYDLPFSHKETRNELISKSGEWILANVNCTGYYRVNYNPENWERLLTQLETNKDVSIEPNNNT